MLYYIPESTLKKQIHANVIGTWSHYLIPKIRKDSIFRYRESLYSTRLQLRRKTVIIYQWQSIWFSMADTARHYTVGLILKMLVPWQCLVSTHGGEHSQERAPMQANFPTNFIAAMFRVLYTCILPALEVSNVMVYITLDGGPSTLPAHTYVNGALNPRGSLFICTSCVSDS